MLLCLDGPVKHEMGQYALSWLNGHSSRPGAARVHNRRTNEEASVRRTPRWRLQHNSCLLTPDMRTGLSTLSRWVTITTTVRSPLARISRAASLLTGLLN
ncbi:hypothetical protein LIA77_01965 [Sarocladium implicatum]|nr:hypothetical protein LIA77_01965 [Sarocladium implicatum]